MTHNLSCPQELLDRGLPTAPALAVAALPDGRRALTTGLDFHLRLWDLDTGTCIRSWDARGPISSIAINSSGTTALLGAVQGVVCWDIINWKPGRLSSLWSHSEITALAWAQTRGMLLAPSEDTTIHRWDTRSGEALSRLTGHRITITALALDHEERYALSGDLYGELRLWDLADGTCRQVWQGHDSPLAAAAFSPQGVPFSAGRDGDIRCWDADTLKSVTFTVDDSLHDMLLLGDGAAVCTACPDGVSIWELSVGERIAKWDTKPVRSLSLSREGTLFGLVRTNHLLAWKRTSSTMDEC